MKIVICEKFLLEDQLDRMFDIDTVDSLPREGSGNLSSDYILRHSKELIELIDSYGEQEDDNIKILEIGDTEYQIIRNFDDQSEILVTGKDISVYEFGYYTAKEICPDMIVPFTFEGKE